jgi:hypothetical protein
VAAGLTQEHLAERAGLSARGINISNGAFLTGQEKSESNVCYPASERDVFEKTAGSARPEQYSGQVDYRPTGPRGSEASRVRLGNGHL